MFKGCSCPRGTVRNYGCTKRLREGEETAESERGLSPGASDSPELSPATAKVAKSTPESTQHPTSGTKGLLVERISFGRVLLIPQFPKKIEDCASHGLSRSWIVFFPPFV